MFKYRHILGVILYILLFHLPSDAQFGVRAGIGISDIAFKDQGQTPYLTYEVNMLEHRLPGVSFQGGLFAQYSLGSRLGIQGELLYSLQGLNYSTNYLYDDIIHKINIHYIKAPILLKYDAFIKEKRKSGFLLGPYVSRKIKATRVTEIEGQRDKRDVSNVKGLDLGIAAGYYRTIKLGSNLFVLDIRSSFSLINMMNYVEGYIPKHDGLADEYARNINVSFNVGYLLSKKPTNTNGT